MSPVVILAAYNKLILFPNKDLPQLKTGSVEGLAEGQAFAVRVEYVSNGSRFCDVANIRKDAEKKIIKILLPHPVVLYLVCCHGSVPLIAALQAFVLCLVIYVIRRARDYKVGYGTGHKDANV